MRGTAFDTITRPPLRPRDVRCGSRMRPRIRMGLREREHDLMSLPIYDSIRLDLQRLLLTCA